MMSIFSCACWASVCLLYKNVYLDLPPIFLTGLLAILTFNCIGCLYILKINPLSIASFPKIFSHSVGCLFVLLMVPFVLQILKFN